MNVEPFRATQRPSSAFRLRLVARLLCGQQLLELLCAGIQKLEQPATLVLQMQAIFVTVNT